MRSPMLALIVISGLLPVPVLASPAAGDAPRAAAPSAEEAAVTTAHSIRAGGRTLDYSATAGTLTIRDDADAPTASIFYVAYTVRPTDGGERPLTFLFNGGPGSASLWLQIGSFGPVRIEGNDPETVTPPPYRLIPNPETLLDRSDLVFIDAVGTGFSRALPGTSEKYFFTVDHDLDAFTRAIRRYVTLYHRWNAPKFLFGESYGATRAAALLRRLQRAGLAMNGAVLLSSILDFPRYHPGIDQGYVGFLPSFAAVAWYHHRVADRPDDLGSFVEAARKFAAGPYATALAQGDLLPPAERARVAAGLSRFTGLPETEIEQADLRIEPDAFAKHLLQANGLVVGRMDGRVTASDGDPTGDAPGFDPADEAVTQRFVAAFMSYLDSELGYRSPLDYRAMVPGLDRRWDWHHQPPQGERETSPDVALDLAAAMRADPSLKILSMNGYFDLVTPFFATESDLHHMMLPPALRTNLRFAYYPAGHMAYLNPDALRRMRADLGRFYAAAAPR